MLTTLFNKKYNIIKSNYNYLKGKCLLFGKKLIFSIVLIIAINLNAKPLFFPLEEPKNYDENIVTLGKELFFDTILLIRICENQRDPCLLYSQIC